MELTFRVIGPDEVEKEVTQREQFNSDEVELIETLVREAHQNSLDALDTSSGRAVRTRLAFHTPSAKSRKLFEVLFRKLPPHLKACQIEISDLDLGAPRFLVIEDFGTTGLLGATDRKDDQPFSDFWRRIGKSHKSGKQGGRRGLGKLVFSGVSRTRTFFGLTVRSDDPTKTPVLMGQAVLATHKDELGHDIDAHGFFCKPRQEDKFQLPESDPTLVGHFARAAGISRVRESGLSIAIPFVRGDIQSRDLIQQLVRNYYFPILMGQLESQIDDVAIDVANFDALAKAYGGNQFEDGKLISFIKDIRSALDQNGPDLTLPDTALGHIEAALSDEQISKLRTRYGAGELIHVRMQVKLRHRRKGEIRSYFDVLMRATDGDGQALVVRGAITLPQEAAQFRARRAFGAMVAQDGGITEFLGDAENPAHTKWNGNAERLTLEWINPSARLREIRMSLNAMAAVLTQAQEKVEPDALIDVLSIPAPAGSPRPKPKLVPDKPPVPPIPQSRRKFTVTQRAGGFSLSGTATLNEADLPMEIKLAAAYDLVRGNPFKKHDPLDFDFREPNDLSLVVEGATVKATSARELTIDVSKTDFSVVVSGFDSNRDLVVQARG
jgi:hypothetical protein